MEVSLVMSSGSMAVFREGISLLLSQWSALQMAVRCEWGGSDSLRKCDDLAAILLSWFSQSKVPIFVDDLEHILDENLVLSFNTEIEDGSVEEIAEQLLVMHEDCLHGNYDAIEKLRKSISGQKNDSVRHKGAAMIEDEKLDGELCTEKSAAACRLEQVLFVGKNGL